MKTGQKENVELTHMLKRGLKGILRNMSDGIEKLVPAQDLKECAVCARLFTSERINTHEVICQKSSTIQRKSFDISEQRSRGTDAEKLTKTVSKNECLLMIQKNGPCGLSTNWRGKHEELIKRIRDVKRRASEKNKKINDLPFSPTIDRESDYVQCQHCLRNFNETSALRHIATCASRIPNSTKNLMNE